MKLIVGIGNPGSSYENTKHNIGFMFLDYYYNYLKITDKWSLKFNGLYVTTYIENEKVIFLKPQSYVNLSGGVVRKYIDYFNIDINDILVVCDDLDLNFCNFKFKKNGSSGGHNGLKDIERNLGTNEYKRLKVGISNNKEIDTKDYVLSKFSKNEIKQLNDLFSNVVNMLNDYYKIDFGDLMSKYNRKNK